MLKDAKTIEQRHQRLKDMYLEELMRQSDNRLDRLNWVRYFENKQFTTEQLRALADRGQSAVAYNAIKPIIKWLQGTERRGRIDFTVSPRIDTEEARESADAKQEVMKWLDHTNQTGHERSMAADQAFVTGLGWLEVSIRQDEQGPKVVTLAEDWRNMMHDSRAVSRDGDDARFVCRTKVVDLDVAQAIFPTKKKQLEKVSQAGNGLRLMGMWEGASQLLTGDTTTTSEQTDAFAGTELYSSRDRVMLLEMWTREPVVRKDKHVGGITDPVSWQIKCTIMTSEDILVESDSPFEHGRFPFVPVWCYRDMETGMPYSPVRDLIDIQDSLNARIIRSQYLAHSNQTHIEKSAVDESAMSLFQIQQELADPNGIAVFADGALSGNKVRTDTKTAGAMQELTALAQLDMDSMNRVSGVVPENRETGPAESGKARLEKANQGALLTADIFDNVMRARWLEGQLTLALCEQYMQYERAIPVSNTSGKRKFKNINHWDGTRYVNDMKGPKAEYVIGEQEWKQSNAMASYQALMAVLSQLAGPAPDVVKALLDVVMEMDPDLPLKDKVLRRVRSVTGQRDEEAELTPEEQAQIEQQQAVQKAQFDAQMAMLQADIRKAQATGEKLEADAMAKRLESLYMAAQGAQVLAMAPQITPIADELLKSAGFVDMGGQSVIAPGPMQQHFAQMQAQQQMPEPEPMQEAAPPELSIPEPQQADGAMAGIETPAADGIDPLLNQPGV